MTIPHGWHDEVDMVGLTAERLRELLHYDPETGIFTWLKRYNATPQWNAHYAGSVAGAFTSSGYVTIQIDCNRYRAHRLAWLWVTGSWPKAEIDHVDLDKANNAFSNLREASRSQNEANKPKPQANTSGFKGVRWHRRARKYLAQIKVDGISKHLGSFDTPEAAHAAYCNAVREHRGEFARVR